MKSLLKAVRVLALGLASLLVVALIAIYLLSASKFGPAPAVAMTELAVPSDSASVEEGGRLARIRGCFDGCHGQGLDGGVWVDEPLIALFHTPNLTQLAARRTDSELELAIRKGVREDGKSVVAMPSNMFSRLSDEDLGKIIAFIRAQPVTEGPSTLTKVGPVGRLGMLLGQYEPVGAQTEVRPPRETPRADPIEWGRYLARTVCSECHGDDLLGEPEIGTPPLVVAGAYRLEQFRRLMREGVATENRELELMSEVARSRFTHFTDDEIAALHTFLSAGAPLGDEGP